MLRVSELLRREIGQDIQREFEGPGARGAGADLAEDHLAVVTAIPFHVREARTEAHRLQHRVPHLAAGAKLGSTLIVSGQRQPVGPGKELVVSAFTLDDVAGYGRIDPEQAIKEAETFTLRIERRR